MSLMVMTPTARATRNASSQFSPASFFSNGEKGFAIDLKNSSYLFDAVSGGAETTEGATIMRVSDISGNGADLIQSVSSKSPLFMGGGGARFGGSGSPMWFESENVIDVAGATKITIVIAQSTRRDEDASVFAEYGTAVNSINGSFNILKGYQSNLRGTATTNRKILPAYSIHRSQYANVATIVLDIQGASSNDRYKIFRINNVDIPLGSELGGWANVGPIPFSNNKMYIGARSGGTLTLTGDVYRFLFINRELTSEELDLAYAWAYAGIPAQPSVNIAAIGDSTIAMYLSQFDVPYYLRSDAGSHCIALPGNTIAQQQTRWNSSVVDKASFDAICVQIGLNDLSNGAETASDVIARLQALIDDINADTLAPIVVAQMNPARAARPDYAKWLAINEAIAGGGATPITGVDARVTGHVSEIGDVDGYLLPIYDTGDGIHPNNSGRAIVANHWRYALVSIGVLN